MPRRLLFLPLAACCRILEFTLRVVRRLAPSTRSFLFSLGSDHATIVYHHLLNFGVSPRLDMPVTYAEKMSWLKLHHNNPLATLCSDKIAVRRYLACKGLSHLEVPIVATYENATEIKLETLPPRFVAKTNHGSNFYVIVRDKSTLDRAQLIWQFNTWLSYDFSRWFAETNYRGIKPRILVEEYIEGADTMVEFKFLCFHGRPRFVSVITSRHHDTPVRGVYDMDWQLQNYGSRGLIVDPVARPRPANFDQLREIAEVLAHDFIHVRVDLMVVDDQVLFSELTFYNLGGFARIEPEPMNAEIGSWIDLSREAEYAERGRTVVAELESM